MARLLGVSLPIKILVANGAIVTVAMLASAAAAVGLLAGPIDTAAVLRIVPMVLVGAAASVAVNAVLVRFALDPLHTLEHTARRIAAGDMDARVPESRLADRDLSGVIRVLNEMLDHLAAHRQRLRAITARALEAAEEERKRLAQELYSDTAQSLSELMIRLRLARARSDAAAGDAALDEVREGLAAAIERLRRYASDLRPPALDMLGLVPAVEAYARSLAGSVGLEVQVRTEPVAGLLAPEAELALYRIIQEALSNAARHSGADRVEVRIERDGGRVVATVEDKGRGFDLAEAERAGAIGLLGMEERAAWVGGRVRVESEPGRGTRVEIEMPVHREEGAKCRT
ncbi:MAG TPA: sensor histidine kinase [Longimicrobiales bacterium]